jgi:hypothetical protein
VVKMPVVVGSCVVCTAVVVVVGGGGVNVDGTAVVSGAVNWKLYRGQKVSKAQLSISIE